MHSLGSLCSRLPNTGGKACVERVACLRADSGVSGVLIHTPIKALRSLWINSPLTSTLYTNCIRVIDNAVDAIQSVGSKFYTLYTPPTITTTTLNIYRRTT